MVLVRLNEKQRDCKHATLKVLVSKETYRKYGNIFSKVMIACADCDVVIARAGTIYINRPEAVKGVILEHYPGLLRIGGDKSEIE